MSIIPVPVDDFRTAMAALASAVSVITTYDGARPHGTTVSAMASLSAEPPMIMLALHRDSDLLRVIRRSCRFGVNVLGHDQQHYATAFARKGPEKAEGAPVTECDGVPRLHGAPGWLVCLADRFVPGGDHVIVLGLVVAAETIPDRPMVYHNQTFGTHTALVR